MDPISRHMRRIHESAKDFLDFFTKSPWAQRHREGRAPANDFVTGNPYQMPLPQISDALRRATVPENKDWFAYKMSENPARTSVARALTERARTSFKPEDVHMTAGGFSAILAAMRSVVEIGDEVLINTPCFFFYEAMILAVGAEPVQVRVKPDFDLDFDAIERAITSKTRVILINTPHNPSGRIYPEEQLTRLAEILDRASAKHGRRIYLLSDEAFSRIVYEGSRMVSPSAFYPHTFVCYTYGKTLLIPGERVGFVALPEQMPADDRAQLREILPMATAAMGWSFPNGTLQRALPELEPLVIDLSHLQKNRDALVTRLREIGYEVSAGEGTFFLLAKSPWPDDAAFVALLEKWEVYTLPGYLAKIPGWIRLSLCSASVDGAFEGFAAALAHARANPRP